MEKFVLDEFIIKLKKIIKRLEYIQKEAKNDVVTLAQARIIFPIIKEKKGFSMQELSEIVGVDKAFVSRTISDLEKKGIIERERKQGSKERNYKIVLTEKGEQFVHEKKEKMQNFSKEWFGNITENEIKVLKHIVERFIKNSND